MWEFADHRNSFQRWAVFDFLICLREIFPERPLPNSNDSIQRGFLRLPTTFHSVHRKAFCLYTGNNSGLGGRMLSAKSKGLGEFVWIAHFRQKNHHFLIDDLLSCIVCDLLFLVSYVCFSWRWWMRRVLVNHCYINFVLIPSNCKQLGANESQGSTPDLQGNRHSPAKSSHMLISSFRTTSLLFEKFQTATSEVNICFVIRNVLLWREHW